MDDLENLFLGARELPPSERAGYLDRACDGDPGLRAQVELMLRRAEAADTFFDVPSTPGGSGDTLPGSRKGRAGMDEGEGSVIGRYKLLERIGEGGMGVVYMAEQQIPVRRRVALKIVKLGLDTRQVVARFEAERQALAMMDHPNIAKVLDAGATESGRPYFVMELVQGIPITEFCDRNKLSIRERLNLFLPVCQAIQSAHQKGVIHRDIKPSNVMVTLHYGDPMPKVIDFGVAKATNMQLTDKTLFTQFGTMIGTPAYMSPEQAEMSSLDVDTRTDVYALGVLLYELLTGSTPFPAERLRSLGFGQMQKVLAEEEPPRPSTRLSTLQGQARTSVSQNRSLGGDLSGGELRGDLDWIVMKCLEKDRRRRYDTVNGLAMDLVRHLSNEPVLARPPSRSYRLQKAFQRNRAGFAAMAGVFVALAVGFGFASWQAVRARRAEALAQDRRADAEAITKFLTQVFKSPNPQQSGYSFTVAQALGAAAARLETDLKSMPERRASLQATLGETYTAIGLPREAMTLQRQVLDFRRTHAGPEAPATLAAMSAMAHSTFEAGLPEEAIRLHAEVEAVNRRIHGPEHPDTLGAMEVLASACFYAGRHGRAAELQKSVLQTRQKSLGPEHPDTLRAMSGLAVTKQRLGPPAEAMAMHVEVLASRRRVLGAEHPETLVDMANLAFVYHGARRWDEAIALQDELVLLRQKVQGREHPQTLMAMHYRAFFNQSRNPEEALALNQEVLGLRRKTLGPEHPDTIISLFYIAENLTRLGRTDEALKVKEEVLQLRRKAQGPEHPHTASATMELADAYLGAGRSVEAIRLINSAAGILPKDSRMVLRIGALQVWFGQDQAYASFRDRLLERAAAATESKELERSVKAASLRPSTDPAFLDSALTLARRAVNTGTNHPHLRESQFALGLAEYRGGQSSKAEGTLKIVAPEGTDPDPLANAATFYRAMVLAHLGRSAEAKATFRAAAGAMRPLPAHPAQPLAGDASIDHLIAWLAYREANTLPGLREDPEPLFDPRKPGEAAPTRSRP